MTMYCTVYDLDEEKIEELKMAMFFAEDDSGMDLRDTFPYYTDIPREIVEQHYDGIMFTDEDFSC